MARKGEAEPAIEPYSFLEPEEGRAGNAASGNDAWLPGDGLKAEDRIETGSMSDGASTHLQSTEPDDFGPASFRGASDADGGSQPTRPDENREAMRDRRLLRFVYATAVLTGVLAVVIYAGGWFFGDSAEKPQGRSRIVVLEQPKAVPEQAPQEASKHEPPVSQKVSPPPKPPAPPAATEPPHQQSGSQPVPNPPVGVQPGGNANMPVTKSKVVADESKIEKQPKPVKPTTPSSKPTPVPKSSEPKETVVARRATGTPAPSAGGHYYIQLASVPSEPAARKLWARLQKKFPDVLGEYELTVQKRVIAKKGTFYRVQVGRFSAFKDVRGLCDLLKARKQPCLPVKR